MKKRLIVTLLSTMLAAMSLSVMGCSGIIQPTIGESGMAGSAISDSNTVGDENIPSTEAGPGEGLDAPDMMFGGQMESEPRPDMSGNIITKFELEKELADARGQLMSLSAAVELYDTENEDGYNALIGLTLDGTDTFTQCTWSEEDGQYILKIDEFTNYESKVIDGVLTIVGVRYDFGMNGKGTLDIPIAGDAEQKNETMEQSTEEIQTGDEKVEQESTENK